MRSPVTALIDQFHNLTPEEAKVFLDLVDPQPEPEPAVKTRKKRGPSKKAQSLSSVISKVPKADAGGNTEGETVGPNCGICGNPADHSDHDPTYLSSHKFEAPKAKKASSK